MSGMRTFDLVVAANRLPVDLVVDALGTSTWQRSPGGLVTAMTGSMAVTSPPGLRCQVLVPRASTTRSTGRRFAATTRSKVRIPDMAHPLLPHGSISAPYTHLTPPTL